MQAEDDAKNIVTDADDKARKEAQSFAKQSQIHVKSFKAKAMANIDEAASIIVRNIL